MTDLNISFYNGFAFISSETHVDYHWILSYLLEFYIKDNIPDPIFAGTDYEKALIGTLDIVFPQTEYWLCFWHMDKNVLANCKPLFKTEETWQGFYDD